METGRQDPDNREWGSIYDETPTQDIGRASEPVLPISETDDNLATTGFGKFVKDREPAEVGYYTQGGEQVAGGICLEGLLRLTLSGDGHQARAAADGG